MAHGVLVHYTLSEKTKYHLHLPVHPIIWHVISGQDTDSLGTSLTSLIKDVADIKTLIAVLSSLFLFAMIIVLTAWYFYQHPRKWNELKRWVDLYAPEWGNGLKRYPCPSVCASVYVYCSYVFRSCPGHNSQTVWNCSWHIAGRLI